MVGLPMVEFEDILEGKDNIKGGGMLGTIYPRPQCARPIHAPTWPRLVRMTFLGLEEYLLPKEA